MYLKKLNQEGQPEILAFNRLCFSPADCWSEEEWAELLADALLRAAGEWADRGEYFSL